MSRQEFEEIMSGEGAAWQIGNQLREKFSNAEIGNFLWESLREGATDRVREEAQWKLWSGADEDAFGPEDLWTFLKSLSDWLDSDDDNARYMRESKFGEKASDPFWDYKLAAVVETKLEEGAELFASKRGGLIEELENGLSYTLAARGLISGSELSEEVADQVARHIAVKGCGKGTIKDAVAAFSEAKEAFGKKLAAHGGQRGAKTTFGVWWSAANDQATPAQRAQWVLNVDQAAIAVEAIEFCLEHFDEDDLQTLVALIVAGRDEPQDYSKPVSRPVGRVVAASFIARRRLQEGKTLDGEELEIFQEFFRPTMKLEEYQVELLRELPTEISEEVILGLFEAKRPGRWKMVSAALTPAVIDAVVEASKEVNRTSGASDYQTMNMGLSSVRELEEHLHIREKFADAIRDLDDPHPILRNLAISVTYLDEAEVEELRVQLDSGELVVGLDDQFDVFGHHTYVRSVLNNRGAKVQMIHPSSPPPKEEFRRDVVLANPGSKAAINAGVLLVKQVDEFYPTRTPETDTPVITREHFRALIGPPLKNARARVEKMLRSARKMNELVHFHLGEPASDSLIARVEKEILGFEMPQALKNLYSEMDGFSVYHAYTRDKSKRVTDLDEPLTAQNTDAISWNQFASRERPSLVYPDVLERKKSMKGSGFYYGAACILPLQEIFFGNDWSKTRYGKEDFYLFDAFDDKTEAALEVNREEESIVVRLCTEVSEGSANLYQWEAIPVEAYIENTLGTACHGRDCWSKNFNGFVTLDAVVLTAE